MGIDHILCIHSSVDGHVGCVYLLTLVISAPRVFVQVFECLFLVLVGTYPGVELLGPLASLCLTEELPDCFPEHPVYFSLCTYRPQQLCCVFTCLLAPPLSSLPAEPRAPGSWLKGDLCCPAG